MTLEARYTALFSDPAFQALQRRRSRFSWLLSALMAGAYFAFILVIAFRPGLFAIPLSSHTVVTWGMPLGVGIIVLGFVLTGIYMYRANGEFDTEMERIIARLDDHD